MKKPVFIIENDQPYNEEAANLLAKQVETTEALKDFEVMIFWQCRAKIYYPPNYNENAKSE